MKLTLYQVDAFAEKPFGGNPAAVVPLDAWLSDATMQAIAGENNLAETAFFVRKSDGAYDLRWFTPTTEVPLCGHATLASAWVVFEKLAPTLETVRFETKSGTLMVEKDAGGWNSMTLPAGPIEHRIALSDIAGALSQALGVPAPAELHFAPRGAGGTPGLLAVWTAQTDIRAMSYSGALVHILRGVAANALLATAPGHAQPYDFVSRFFAPDLGVNEDPVTGSMHGTLIPFWAKRLGKKHLRAYQASARGGDILCTDDGARVVLAGPCALYLTGEIDV